MVKSLFASAGDERDTDLILGLGGSPRGGNGKLLSIFAWRSPRMRTLVGYSSWGRKESDMTDDVHSHNHLSVHLLL